MSDGFGWHWLAEARGCDPAVLADADALTAMLDGLAHALGLTVMSPARVHPVQTGLAGIVLLGESHAAVHTDGERGIAWVDVFSCTDLDAGLAEAFVRRTLRPDALSCRLVER